MQGVKLNKKPNNKASVSCTGNECVCSKRALSELLIVVDPIEYVVQEMAQMLIKAAIFMRKKFFI